MYLSTFLDVLHSYNINPTITNSPTRISAVSSTLIDNISCNFLNFNSKLTETGFSDHMAVILNTDITIDSNNNDVIRKYNYCHSNVNKFCNYINSETWNIVKSTCDVNEKFNNFHDLFMYHFTNAFPYQSIKCVKNNQIKNCEWITPELKLQSQHVKNIHWLMKKLVTKI